MVSSRTFGRCLRGTDSTTEFHVLEAPERFVACEEPRPESAGGRIADRIRIGQLRPSGLEGHGLEQPLVLRLDGDAPEASELTAGLSFASVPKDGEIQFHEVPDAGPQLGGKVPAIPGFPRTISI